MTRDLGSGSRAKCRCRCRGCLHRVKTEDWYCYCCLGCRQATLLGRHPRVVVLCGSSRFPKAWAAAMLDRTLVGEIVLTIGCDTHSDEDLGITPEQKSMLDELHERKIDLADYVLVVSEGGYFGESTASEIEYAEWLEKPVEWIEKAARERWESP